MQEYVDMMKKQIEEKDRLLDELKKQHEGDILCKDHENKQLCDQIKALRDDFASEGMKNNSILKSSRRPSAIMSHRQQQ